MSRERRPLPPGTTVAGSRYIRDLPTFASFPQQQRRVELCCPRGHLVAIVGQVSGDDLPVIYRARQVGIVPTLVLLPDGLAGAATSPDPERVLPVGDAVPSMLMGCRDCDQKLVVTFGDIRLALDKPGRRRRVTLAAAHRSD